LELVIVGAFTEVRDPALADDVMARLRCFDSDTLEREVDYLALVGHHDCVATPHPARRSHGEAPHLGRSSPTVAGRMAAGLRARSGRAVGSR